MAGVSIRNVTRQSVPRFAYAKLAAEVLPGWDISLVFIGPSQARTLNKNLRAKSYTPNVLSYAVGKKSGEILICPSEVRQQAKSYSMDVRTFTLYLFIHAVLHLKGWAHGVTMERCERKLVARFATHTSRVKTYGPQNSNRHRHRHLPSKGSRR